MEHIELAGVHSGDSACVLPSMNISAKNVAVIKEYTAKIAKELGVVGLMNMQYAIEDDVVYVLEANPRASRTVPLVSKVCNIQMVRLATDIMTLNVTGRKSPLLGLKKHKFNHCGVKEAVLPFSTFPEVDPVLGPEMRSTGEVLGIADNFGEAFFKAEEAAGSKLPLAGKVFLSVNDKDKDALPELAQGFKDCGFDIIATFGTAKKILDMNLAAEVVNKLHEGGRSIVDEINEDKIALVINTPSGKKEAHDDSYIRKAAVKARVPYITTIAAAKAALAGIKAAQEKKFDVKSLQDFHREISE